MEQQAQEVHYHFASGCNPVIYQGPNYFYGSQSTAQQNNTQSSTTFTQQGSGEARPQPSAARALRTLAKEIPGSRRFKWGFAYQAMQECGMIKPSMGVTEFARTVEKYTGISWETVRHEGQYFEPSAQFRDRINDILKMIDGVCGSEKS